MRHYTARIIQTFVVLGLLLTTSGMVTAVPLISGDGTETCTQGAALGGGSCAVTAITPHPLWQPNHPNGTGAHWISYADTGEPGAVGAPNRSDPLITITETFSAGAGAQLVLDVWADDTAEVFIDGRSVFAPNFTQNICANGSIGCEPNENAHILHTFTSAGSHSVAFATYQQGGGPFGLLYAGTLESGPLRVAAAVPEPATWLLFGVGLIGCLSYGWCRQRAVTVSCRQ